MNVIAKNNVDEKIFIRLVEVSEGNMVVEIVECVWSSCMLLRLMVCVHSACSSDSGRTPPRCSVVNYFTDVRPKFNRLEPCEKKNHLSSGDEQREIRVSERFMQADRLHVESASKSPLFFKSS